MKCIKKMNDFVLGILMILLSAFLVFGKITETEVKTGQGGFLVRSDVWLRMMGVFLIIVAVILIIRSFGKKEGEEAEGFHLERPPQHTQHELIVHRPPPSELFKDVPEGLDIGAVGDDDDPVPGRQDGAAGGDDDLLLVEQGGN